MEASTPKSFWVRLAGTAGPWSIKTYESVGAKSIAGSQDTALVLLRPDGVLRLAVIDGVTPSQGTPSFVGVDGARYAAGLIRTALTSAATIEDCLLAANAALYSPNLQSRAQAQATVVCADLSPDGRVHMVRSCDCEAWVARSDRGWESLFPSAHRAWALAAWDQYLTTHPELRSDAIGRQEAEQEVWGHPEAWESLPVGREPVLRSEIRDLQPGSWQTLLLTTDGSESRLAGASRLDELITNLERTMTVQPYDDTTVIIVSRLYNFK